MASLLTLLLPSIADRDSIFPNDSLFPWSGKTARNLSLIVSIPLSWKKNVEIFNLGWVLRFRVKMEVDVPVSVAYNFYLDRESFPKWMPFISSVEVDLIFPN